MSKQFDCTPSQPVARTATNLRQEVIAAAVRILMEEGLAAAEAYLCAPDVIALYCHRPRQAGPRYAAVDPLGFCSSVTAPVL
ncbi:hypothetical protein CSZ94_17240 [Janthinobacterium sp. ROICE36]|uniref:hypothetical protein n=1 Tax=Janthinobacterium sp. ROICE36 TaxID=2048670 RepID=UPI000C7EEF69|nr:hypothetical protein [Janthinobacterium sp. ROICE36]PLY41175.1 hypothetical protein CSZ94_17240 [Janthinobacterium sp. ROICE36]